MRRIWRAERLEDRRMLAAGDLDSTFDGDGRVTTDFVDGMDSNDDFGNELVVQSDGKIVVVGHSGALSIGSGFEIARYNSDGSLDAAFGAGGRVVVDLGTDSKARAVAIQSDGKIVVAGHGSGGASPDFAVVRLNANGTLDGTLDGDGILTTDLNNLIDSEDFAEGVAVDAAGRIVVAGYSRPTASDDWDIAVVRYAANGALDASFSGDGIALKDVVGLDDQAFDVAIQVDAKIVLAGHSFKTDADPGTDDDPDFAAIRYNSDGTLDGSFDGDGIATTDLGVNSADFGKSLALQAGGSIIVAGDSVSSEADLAVVRYTSAGALDVSFDGDGRVTIDFGSTNEFGEDVLVQSDGKIVVGGCSEQGSTGFDFAIARLSATGSLDVSFGGDGKVTTDFGNDDQDQAFGLALQDDGKILAAGFSTNIDGGNDFAIARYLANGVGLSPDACDPTKTQLIVTGTSGDDIIKVHKVGPGSVEVTLNGTSLGTFGPTGRIIVFADAGDDEVQVSGSITNPVWVYGGGDDDHIKGGGGNDVLLGGEGDDMLVGGSGRDLLIGGTGRDRLVGNSDDDILVAGFTDHDDNEEALCHIMKEWTRTDASFFARVLHLEGLGEGGCSGGLNEPYFLNDETVHDDGVQDVLTGSSGSDWFLFNWDGDCNSVSRDKATDMHLFEALFAEDIDFINSDF
jgi:uncharacterized delta-60 repeat protein